MKILNQIRLIGLCLLLASISTVKAENQPESLKYINAQELRVINKGFDDTEGDYTRIPKYLKDSVRPTLWERAMCSSGIAIRFATDSKRIGVRYKLLWNTHMAHMADTGLKGTDLYRLSDNGIWEYVNTNRPNANKEDKQCEKIYVENLKGDMREFMIYLPLYDGVTELFVGVDSVSTIQKPLLDNPRAAKRIIMYGTSILQGGCSTRTGMVATSMIQRDLNCEVVNIGISGEGKMDMCMARAMAKMKNVSAYVIDPIPNCTEMMCDTLTYGFVNCLRTLRPEIPIVMVEGPIYPYAKFDSFFEKYLPKKNAAFRKNYELLKKENPKNLYYITAEGLSGYDNEGTVDGIHFTDLGFRHYADKLIPVLKQFVK
ncbi:MAG: SGNH/GDSL hydrolase family protein [Muribaculaceae bacterium]|nr:SGNH/GDSL hydrolase family protein [Muribaculaceae bacterium]